MPLLDLLDQEYLSKSSDQNQAELHNMYLETDAAKGKYKYIACPTPGLSVFKDTALSPVRDIYSHNNVLYAVAANKFIRVASDGTQTVLGTLNTSTGFAKIKAITGAIDTNNQLLIIDGTNGYTYNLGTSTATFPISDADFPQTCIDIDNQDDYFLAVKANSMQFQISNVSDGTSWAALDFASKFGQADNINAILSHESKIWLMGNKTTEIWYNSGDTNFPFTRVSDTFLHYGCPAKATIAVNGNYFIFLTYNGKGGYSVSQTMPRIYYYNPVPISTPAIETLIGTFTTVSDAFASIYNKDGHEFYEITFPTAGYTFVYDIPKSANPDQDKGVWTIRESYNGATYGRFLGSCKAFCYGKNLVGDYNSGIIYSEESAIYTENGTAIRRLFVSPPGPTYMGGKRVFFSRLQIDVETGVGSNKTFTLEKSVDNGSTWTTVNTYTIPGKGGRIFEPRLGSSRYGMIFRITTTMDAKFIILGFQVEANMGHS